MEVRGGSRMKENIAVIGIGAIGTGVVHCFAKEGFHVYAVTSNGEDKMTPYMDRQVEKNNILQREKEHILGNITHTSLNKLPPVNMVVESIPENQQEKCQLFTFLDQNQPEETVLATSTSTIPISSIAGAVQHQERIIGMHFTTPVPKMSLVEVIKSVHTNKKSMEKILSYCEKIDKTPVVVKDFPGFVMSRLTQAIINEAAYIFQEGIADAESIDKIAKLGLNLPIGPLKLVDHTGIDTTLNVMDSMHQSLGTRYFACPVLRQKVYDGHTGRKVGQGFYKYND